MGRIQKRSPLRKGPYGYYEIWYRAENGRWKRRSTHTEDYAQAYKMYQRFVKTRSLHPELELEPEPPKPPEPEPPKPEPPAEGTLHAVLDLYWAKCAIEQKGAATTQSNFRALKRGLPNKPVEELTIVDMDAYKEGRRNGKFSAYGKTCSNGTVRRDMEMLQQAVTYAQMAKCVPQNLKLPIRKPPQPPSRDHFLSEEQVMESVSRCMDLLEDQRHGRAALFFIIAAMTAQRKHAIERLTWSQVMWDVGDHGVIDFRRSAEDRADDANDNRKRSHFVPVSRRLRKVLEWAYERRKNNYVLGTDYTVHRIFENLCQEVLGLPKGTTANVLRHTWATHAAKHGVPMQRIADMLGNRLTTAERHYRHLHPGFLRGVADSVFGREVVAPSLEPPALADA